MEAAKTTKLRILYVSLRLLALGATVSAAFVMATSHQKIYLFSAPFEAKYSHTTAFKYFLIANVVGSVYGILMLFPPPKNFLWRLALVADVVMTMLLMSSVSAALAIAHVGKEGNSYAGWLPICDKFHKYCDQVAGALIAAFLAVILYLLLLLYTIHTILR
nr:CASP-like protein 1C2 [Ipomoea trifida]GMC70455.1 CASP-like protein 1C1 [Ipomoea batatas]